MRRQFIWQYVFMGIGWALALVSLPLRGADLNGFLGWNGDVSTGFFIRFLLTAPRELYHDWRSFADPVVLPAAGELVWMAAAVLGILLFVFSPPLVRRKQLWGVRGQRIIRIAASLLLMLPAALVMPPSAHLPRPQIGVYLLATGHVLVFFALLMTPSKANDGPAFTIQTPT